MNEDPIWKAFAESGDPLYYLLYRVLVPDGREREDKGSVT